MFILRTFNFHMNLNKLILFRLHNRVLPSHAPFTTGGSRNHFVNDNDNQMKINKIKNKNFFKTKLHTNSNF